MPSSWLIPWQTFLNPFFGGFREVKLWFSVRIRDCSLLLDSLFICLISLISHVVVDSGMHREYEERVNGFRSAREEQPPQCSAKDCFHVMFILFLFYYEVVKKLIENAGSGVSLLARGGGAVGLSAYPKINQLHPPPQQPKCRSGVCRKGLRGLASPAPPSKQSVKIIRNLAYIVLLAKVCDVHRSHAITGLLKQELRLQSMSTAFYLSSTLDSPTLLFLKSALTAVPL